MKFFKSSVSLVVAALFSATVAGSTAFASDDAKTITVLGTSDIHGMLYPYDYATDSETEIGWAKIATLIKQEREIDPNLILVDNGDTSQANLISEFRFDDIHPVVKALNLLNYDTWTLGNHEFNFEFENLQRAIADFEGVTLAGNIYDDDARWQNAYTIKDVDGVRVAIFGMTAPHVPLWEKTSPEHYNFMTFTSLVDEAGKILDEIEGLADVVIAVVHYGAEGEYGEKGLNDIAELYADRIDAIVSGHAHDSFAEIKEFGDNSVAMFMPGSLGAYLGKVTLDVVQEDGQWVVTEKTAEILPTNNIPADQEFLDELAYVHEASLEIANTVLGTISDDFLETLDYLPGIPRAVVQDTALVDLINIVQLEASGADVSLAALFDRNSNLPKGDFRFKDAVNVYKYDNTLYAVEISGAELKEIMESYAGNYFNTFKEGDVTISFKESIRLYNYDMFAGVDYKIDISKPEGERIVDIMYNGAPLANDQQLVLAVNNYRYGQLMSNGMISEDPSIIVYESSEAIRDMIAEYVSEKGVISPVVDNNWSIVGYDFSDPQAELIYEMMRNGEITTTDGASGRAINIEAINAIELRANGILPQPAATVVAVEVQVAESQPEPTVELLIVERIAEPEPIVELLIVERITEPEPIVELQSAVIVPVESSGNHYTVESGDNLWNIAGKILGSGTRWSEIYQLNTNIISNPDLIYIGQRLQMPNA